MDESARLEKLVSDNPFDLGLRADWARALKSAEKFEEALKQWELIVGQEKSPGAFWEKAICLLALERGEEALGAHVLAKGLPDQAAAWELIESEDQEKLEGLGAEAAPAGAPLRMIAGGAATAPGRVVSIHRAETVRFADVAGMDHLKKTLRLKIIEPFLRPGLFQRFRRKAGGGVLLYGPPGCGKTMIAKAIASECNANFTAIGISDVLNMWIGESEKNLAEIFSKAREEKPTVLFFDELDALAFSRSKANSDHTRTMVNEFLNQLDGMNHDNEGILILGATNLPWDVDTAMKRPGRFDRQVFVPPPDAEARHAMLEMKLRDIPCGTLNLRKVAQASDGFSGADIDGVIELAKDQALMRTLESGEDSVITEEDLLQSSEEAHASTSDWLKTARNLVKFGGAGAAYKDVEKYLRSVNQY